MIMEPLVYLSVTATTLTSHLAYLRQAMAMLPLIKNANFSSCETDFSRRSSLTVENYDVLTIQLRLWQVLTHLEASLVVEESIVVEKI